MPTPTLMPLETLREQIAYHIWHFYQMADKDHVPLTDNCNTLVREYGWQTGDAAGREDMRRAIKVAEEKLRDNGLSFDVGLRYNSETIDVGFLKVLGGNGTGPYPAFASGGIWWQGWPGGWSPAEATLRVGKLSKIATVSRTSLSAGVAVTLSDSTGLYGIYDTFTALIADATTDITLVEAYVPVADQYPKNRPLEEWQIRPVTVTRPDANHIQVQGPAWLIVKPKFYVNPITSPVANYKLYGVDTAAAVDPTQATSYLGTIDLYVKTYTNPNVATWLQDDGGNITSNTIEATIADARNGIVRLDFQGCTAPPATCVNGNVTQRVQINYEAGDDIANWETVVTRLALAELKKSICACADANTEIMRWQQDMARVGNSSGVGIGEAYRIDNEDLGNPFGTRRGQVEAWNAVNSSALMRGINISSY